MSARGVAGDRGHPAGAVAEPECLGLDVLIVEDGEDAADSMATVLVLDGHRPRVVRSGAAALAAARACPPDVVLLDLRMPGMDGWQIASALRRKVGERRPLMVAVTGCGGEGDRRRAEGAGIDLYLLKPVNPEMLLEVLRRFQGLLA